MYKWFAVKRMLKGIFTYVIIIFIMSVLFNHSKEVLANAKCALKHRRASAS